MKKERELIYLERAISQSDFAQARKLIEHNMEFFTKTHNRAKLSMEGLTLLNCVLELHNEENENLYSRETQLIIQHINSLARDCRFAEIKRFSFLQKDLLSNPKIYNALSSDAKALIAPPKDEELPQQ